MSLGGKCSATHGFRRGCYRPTGRRPRNLDRGISTLCNSQPRLTRFDPTSQISRRCLDSRGARHGRAPQPLASAWNPAPSFAPHRRAQGRFLGSAVRAPLLTCTCQLFPGFTKQLEFLAIFPSHSLIRSRLRARVVPWKADDVSTRRPLAGGDESYMTLVDDTLLPAQSALTRCVLKPSPASRIAPSGQAARRCAGLKASVAVTAPEPRPQ